MKIPAPALLLVVFGMLAAGCASRPLAPSPTKTKGNWVFLAPAQDSAR